ncbi:uncharacterized protein LOC132759853, partial [Ruditapes philippinarum]|uniref:uncharacterized protein LOC132759853 n=1 Tax=Ruditapes philippinarum TaxID=129788 RepID=UPI00295C155A
MSRHSVSLTTLLNKPSESDRLANNKLGNGLIALGVVNAILFIIVIIVIITLTCVRQKLTNIKLEDTKMHLEWTDCLNCCCCCQRIFGYSIVRKPKHGQETDINKENVTKEKQCTLETLDPMAIYEICLSRKFWCFRSFAQRRSVITRKLGMLNDQGNVAKSTSIDVWWTKPDCITNPQMKYKVTCNEEVTEENTGKTKSTIKGRMPKKTYKIEVFAIDDGTNSLLFAENITTTPLQVCLGDFCYKPGQSCVECNITWTVKDFDIQEHLNESDNFYFIVKWCIEGQEVDKREKIRASRYTIPKLYPKHSYTVYVYPVYHSVTFERAMIELATP